MRLERLLRSRSLRLATVCGGLLVLAFVIAGWLAWLSTQSIAEAGIRQRVELEMDALQDEGNQEGASAVIATIVNRVHNPGALDYRLLDRNGRFLIGNLQIDHSEPGWHVIDLPIAEDEDERRDFVVLTARTSDGGLLSIGDNLARGERIQEAVLGALAWVGLATVVLVMAAGFIAARGTLRRVDVLSETMERVGAGDLSARVRVDERGDDIDTIGQGVNSMLERVGVVVADVKRVSTDIAHDLRTPLAHLRQTLETAARRDDLDAIREDVQIATDKVASIQQIFDAMLRLSAIEAGVAKERFAEVDVTEVVERLTDAYRPISRPRGRLWT